MQTATSAKVSHFEDFSTADLKRQAYQYWIAQQRPKTWREQLNTLLTVDYIKQIAPSVVLAVVAILALSASGAAQARINELNSTLASSQAQLLTAQASINQLTSQLQQIQQQFSTLETAATTPLYNANVTYVEISAMKSDTHDFLDRRYNDSLSIFALISALNESYPYPWQLQQRLDTAANNITDLQQRSTSSNSRIQVLEQQMNAPVSNDSTARGYSTMAGNVGQLSSSLTAVQVDLEPSAIFLYQTTVLTGSAMAVTSWLIQSFAYDGLVGSSISQVVGTAHTYYRLAPGMYQVTTTFNVQWQPNPSSHSEVIFFGLVVAATDGSYASQNFPAAGCSGDYGFAVSRYYTSNPANTQDMPSVGYIYVQPGNQCNVAPAFYYYDQSSGTQTTINNGGRVGIVRV